MVTENDLYDVLGVPRGATAAEIKKAAKRKGLRYHPDRNKDPGAEQKFKEIQYASSVLLDPEKRANYDRFGNASFTGGFNGQGGAGGFEDIFRDLFGSFGDQFGSQFGDARSGRGQDIRINLKLELEDAIKGCRRKVLINARAQCEKCEGTGFGASSRQIDCPRCDGQGLLRRQAGIFSMQETCSQCQGSGKIIEDPCTDCAGAGRVRRKREVSINVPAGIGDNDILRVAGEGEAGIGGVGTAGDLLAQVTVKEHPVFERQGDDLHCTLPIQFSTAALGGLAKIPTLDGYHEIKIPKGVQSGTRLKIRGKGVQGIRSGRTGDLFCTLRIETPQNLNEEQTELLRKLDKTLSVDPGKHSPERASWLKKVKKLLGSPGSSKRAKKSN